VATDRLGSVRANGNGERMVYTAYGTERTSTADGREKFGTYFRDGTGLDYADQRYYGDTGRFLSPDPAGLSAVSFSSPGSWNRYGYALGDPVNLFDPQGLDACGPGWMTEAWLSGPCQADPCNPGTQSQFNYTPTPPNPGCPTGGSQPKPQSQPNCFIQLKYRPTGGSDSGNHAFIWVQDENGNQWIVSGGPSNGKLDVWVSTPQQSPSNSLSSSVAYSSGLGGGILCDKVNAILAGALGWPQDTIPYNYETGPNSNTAADLLLGYAGIHIAAPPNTKGWW
jgi:RHS repeat-associated protein